MNKKLAIVNHNLGSGGAEKLIYDMALELKEKKIEFSVILLTSVSDIYGRKLIEEGINVIYLSDKWDIYSPKNIFRLKVFLKDYDVVHTHTYAAQLWTAFASLFLRRKRYITTEHSTTNNRRGKIHFKILDRWMYSRYNKIVSITEATQKNLKKWLNNKNEEKYIVINNGINLEKYYSTIGINRRKINSNLKKEDILICMVGRFSEQKDQKTVIKSMQILDESYKLLLLGDGNKVEEQNLVDELSLKERVYFLGYKSNVAEIVKSCDIAVLSSHSEGFGLAAVESMALGIPTIGSDVDGLREVLENGGVTFECGDSNKLSKLILKYTTDKLLYIELSEVGIKKSKEYDIKIMSEKYRKEFWIGENSD